MTTGGALTAVAALSSEKAILAYAESRNEYTCQTGNEPVEPTLDWGCDMSSVFVRVTAECDQVRLS